MTFQRPLVLAGILIALLLGYAFQSNFSHPEASFRRTIPPSELAPLPGRNSISGLTITPDKGAWRAEFDYYYTGQPKFAALRIELAPSLGSSIGHDGSWRRDTYLPAAQRGQHHVSAAITYPGAEQTTRQISAKLLRSMTGDEVIASQVIDKVIDWPTFQTWIQTTSVQR